MEKIDTNTSINKILNKNTLDSERISNIINNIDSKLLKYLESNIGLDEEFRSLFIEKRNLYFIEINIKDTDKFVSSYKK